VVELADVLEDELDRVAGTITPGSPLNVYSAATISIVRLGSDDASVAGLSAPQATSTGDSNSGIRIRRRMAATTCDGSAPTAQ
jgi:hypothetical protein